MPYAATIQVGETKDIAFIQYLAKLLARLDINLHSLKFQNPIKKRR